jgi:hypothetical protein
LNGVSFRVYQHRNCTCVVSLHSVCSIITVSSTGEETGSRTLQNAGFANSASRLEHSAADKQFWRNREWFCSPRALVSAKTTRILASGLCAVFHQMSTAPGGTVCE